MTEKLAAPGAGLPPIELWLTRILFSLYRRGKKRREVDDQFHRERDLIVDLIDRIPKDAQQRPTLIRRPVGIEDSSRNWSVAMTVEHLTIVTTGIGGLVKSLTSGRRAELRPVSIANVKPPVRVDDEFRERFLDSLQTYRTTVDAIPDLHSTTMHKHPWFGPLNAHGWHCLQSVHLGIHRRQITAIRAALRL